MRTKTLLLTAALTAAGAATSLAQAVYSQNTVGYVNLNLVAGYNLVANPLDVGGNTLAEVLPSAPNNARVFKFSNGTFEDAVTFITGVGWFPDATKKLSPGEGAFIQLDAAASLTFVGQVHEGNISSSIATGYSIQSSQLPISLPLGKASDPEKTSTTSATTLRFPAANNDQIYQFNAASQGYKDASTYIDGIGWFPGDVNGPAPGVGEAFFVLRSAAKSWTRNYAVSP